MTTLTPPTKPAPTDIRQAGDGDVARLAESLARAFHDDPVFAWITPDERRRRAQLPAFFELFAHELLPHGACHLAGPGLGAALWAPPGEPPVREETAEAFTTRLVTIVGPDAERALEVVELVDSRHPTGSFWFLQFLGVVPEQRGRGIGSSLLAHVLERCDRDGTPAYLDATSPRNRALYERHGFRAIGEYGPEGGPSLWQMWREPTA